jgi:putative endonuclease
VAKTYYYVYVLASLTGTLYVGLTDHLALRVSQHRIGTYDGFTKKHKIDRLMYYEVYEGAQVAALREKQVKKYRREKKVALIEIDNPEWKDLSRDLYSVRRARASS